MVRNVLDLPMLRQQWGGPGMVPPEALPVFLHHSILLSFLIVTSLCDLEDMEIPLTVTVTGALVGLILAMLLPWPFPEPPPAAPAPVPGPPRLINPVPPYPGAYPWPVWYPLPAWLPPGSWQLGLATGLAGALAGLLMLRGVRLLFGLGRGVEGLGVGDADLMMMAGAFVGWQPVVLAFFISVGPGAGLRRRATAAQGQPDAAVRPVAGPGRADHRPLLAGARARTSGSCSSIRSSWG